MKNKLIKNNAVTTIIPCDCGCSLLEISDWEDMNESFITLYVRAFNEKQTSIFSKIKRRVKSAWFMLRGKEFLLYEICIPKSQLRDLLNAYLFQSAEDLMNEVDIDIM